MKRLVFILFTLLAIGIQAQNRPYADEKPVHFGFSLGLNFMSFATPTIVDPIDGKEYHARVSSLTPGFSVGFITDVRLSRHLNLRLTPSLHFGAPTVTYHAEPSTGDDRYYATTSLPITIPLLLKWSAERERNYRPYLIGGGGARFECMSRNEKDPIRQKVVDCFVEVGAGCDFYFPWFKLCPQLTYSIGFLDALAQPIGTSVDPDKKIFHTSLAGLINHQLTLSFNFE